MLRLDLVRTLANVTRALAGKERALLLLQLGVLLLQTPARFGVFLQRNAERARDAGGGDIVVVRADTAGAG